LKKGLGVVGAGGGEPFQRSGDVRMRMCYDHLLLKLLTIINYHLLALIVVVVMAVVVVDGCGEHYQSLIGSAL